MISTSKETVGTFYEKELQKQTKKQIKKCLELKK